jgi:hypothetical protein
MSDPVYNYTHVTNQDTPREWDWGAFNVRTIKTGGASNVSNMMGIVEGGAGSGDMVGVQGRANIKDTNSGAVGYAGYFITTTTKNVLSHWGGCGAEINHRYESPAICSHFGDYTLDGRGAYSPTSVVNLISEDCGFIQENPMSACAVMGRNQTWVTDEFDNRVVIGKGAPFRTGIFWKRDSLAARDPVTDKGEWALVNGGEVPGKTAPNFVSLRQNWYYILNCQQSKAHGAVMNVAGPSSGHGQTALVNGRLYLLVDVDYAVDGRRRGVEIVDLGAK